MIRTHAEKIIDEICEEHSLLKPRVHRLRARKDYLNIVCRKRKCQAWLRPKIRKMLNYVKRDIGFVNDYLEQGYKISSHRLQWWETIQALFTQQQYMYDNRTHCVENRIVSFSQPWLRPIVRGKSKTNVEFGVKLDMSIDHNGLARLEKTSFDAYNESTVLINAIRRFYDREGHFP